MCGIFGSEKHAEAIAKLQAMKYRGPDEQLSVRAAGFTLGVARLAIVDVNDPEAGQPHISKNRNLLAFNGEIYNYRELSHPYLTTEVQLLSDMIDNRDDIRHYLDGDYAVAHFNPSTSRLTLYRDRFGVCPLYYQTKPHVAVSSEWRRLKNPREVPAHGRVVINVRYRRLLSKDIMPLYGASSTSSCQDTVRFLLEAAVATRALHTESSFSLALSGGLDSSLLALALHAQGFKEVECIVTAFSEKSEDLDYAARLAEKLRYPLTVVRIEAGQDQAKLLEHLDTPNITNLRYQGALRSWFVAKYAKTRVILCGDGGDELLGGYPSHERVSGYEYRVSRKRLVTLRSMQHFNLDRTNKMGMAHSKEFRVPLLASAFSQLALSLPYFPGKLVFRELARYYGAPEIANRERKYSPDELEVKL